MRIFSKLNALRVGSGAAIVVFAVVFFPLAKHWGAGLALLATALPMGFAVGAFTATIFPRKGPHGSHR